MVGSEEIRRSRLMGQQTGSLDKLGLVTISISFFNLKVMWQPVNSFRA